MSAHDTTFAGSIPELYEHYMVPLIFAPYADDIAHRVSRLQATRILEIAAGTGVVTRALSRLLPPGTRVVATDLNQAMLDWARSTLASSDIEWQQADASALPFDDASFDVVACQFGAMFFPDKAGAFAEARRVLRPGGTFVFSVWDRIAENEFADVVTQSLEAVFPADPPRFLARTPHGYHDVTLIEQDLAAGGFRGPPAHDVVTERSRAASGRIPAVAYCQGTPLRNEIEARDPSRLDEATERAAAAMTDRFGPGSVDGRIQALVFTVTH